MQRWFVFTLLVFLPLAGYADDAGEEKDLLTLDRIFKAGEFTAKGYGPVQWREEGRGYLLFEKNDTGGRDLMVHDPASGKKSVFVPAHQFVPSGKSGPLSIDAFELSDDESKILIFTNSKRVWRARTRGDYWVLDRTSRELRQLGGDAAPSSLMFADFSPDGMRVAYVIRNNLYVECLEDSRIEQLTHDGSETLINGTFGWVYEEEFRLRKGFRWSPDGRHLAYWRIDQSGVRVFNMINNTDALYPRLVPLRYPKTGTKNPAARVGVVSAAGGETTWLEFPGDPREHYIAGVEWAENPPEIVIQRLNRLQNTNRVMLADPRTGRTRTILTETDRAWVDVGLVPTWIDEGRSFLWLSERDGWAQLYRVSRSGDEVRRITNGDFDVVRFSRFQEEHGSVYFVASPENPTQRYLYRVGLDGEEPVRVTPADRPGTHGYSISPDCQWAIHTWSAFGEPARIDLIRLPSHEVVRAIEANAELREKLSRLQRCQTEFFRVDIGEGIELDGWCIRPPEFDPARKYPVLFHVYGEPAGQTVLDRWGGRTYLWHLLLAQRGYLVMSLDNRGTPAPRGREWRKCVYRRIGVLASSDQAAGVRRSIADRPYIDPDRIAIWGWSGGGSMALNALFRYPDLYAAGMSVASVPNMRLYDTIYQERYMGLPSDNAEGYVRGSPITFAHQLRGKLLLVHGTGDDNVHYQGAEALVNELVAHNKQFTLMTYPNRRHGISEGQNTTRHLFTLLTDFLEKSLGGGLPEPRP